MFELRQNLQLAQKLVMTPQLQQAIKLLQLNRMELADALRAEIEKNPMLEEKMVSPDNTPASDFERQGIREEPVTSQVEGDSPGKISEINWDDYSNNFDTNFSFSHEVPAADAPSQFDFIHAEPGLDAFLLWQLSHLDLDELDTRLTQFIVGNIDERGFFDGDIADIVRCNDCSEEEAEAALRIVQSLDPVGVAARDIRESFLLQLDLQGLEDTLAWQIVEDHMELLKKNDYSRIARLTGTTVKQVNEAVDIISGLVSYPGSNYSNEQVNYVVPDVYVYKIDDEFVIYLNDEDLPTLEISSEYQTILKQKNLVDQECKQYLQENKRNAEWFIKSIQQRQKTIYKVVESLLKFQRDFFEKGASGLRPLILRDVAEDINMHESTISRITSNKYIHTPQGIYELKYFFSTAVATTDGDVVSSESIKNRIKQIVAAEDPAKPLSDNKISQLLAEEKMKVARRTVAKYREQLNILPVKYRRQKK